MKTVSEHELVVLKRDLPEHNLQAGDIGVVVFCYKGKGGYEVEFAIYGDDPMDPITLTDTDLRSLRQGEILHARMVA